MQLIKDLWNVVKALLAVVKTLVSYVRIVIHGVENLIGKLAHKKAAPAPAPVVEEAAVPAEAPAISQPSSLSPNQGQ